MPKEIHKSAFNCYPSVRLTSANLRLSEGANKKSSLIMSILEISRAIREKFAE
jgi:hypothetical protein